MNQERRLPSLKNGLVTDLIFPLVLSFGREREIRSFSNYLEPNLNPFQTFFNEILNISLNRATLCIELEPCSCKSHQFQQFCPCNNFLSARIILISDYSQLLEVLIYIFLQHVPIIFSLGKHSQTIQKRANVSNYTSRQASLQKVTHQRILIARC